MSDELIEHVASRHPCQDDAARTTSVCPCGETLVICCNACGEIVFLL